MIGKRWRPETTKEHCNVSSLYSHVLPRCTQSPYLDIDWSRICFMIYPITEQKEYATIYTMMAYLTPTPFRIKADRIFSKVQTSI